MRKAYDDHTEAAAAVLDANWRMLLDLSKDCEFFADFTWDERNIPDETKEENVLPRIRDFWRTLVEASTGGSGGSRERGDRSKSTAPPLAT